MNWSEFFAMGGYATYVWISYGLMAVILIFIGVKLVLAFLHGLNPAIPHIPTPVSLAFIVLVLAVPGLASWLKVRKDPAAHAHAGRVGGGHHEEPSE